MCIVLVPLCYWPKASDDTWMLRCLFPILKKDAEAEGLAKLEASVGTISLDSSRGGLTIRSLTCPHGQEVQDPSPRSRKRNWRRLAQAPWKRMARCMRSSPNGMCYGLPSVTGAIWPRHGSPRCTTRSSPKRNWFSSALAAPWEAMHDEILFEGNLPWSPTRKSRGRLAKAA